MTYPTLVTILLVAGVIPAAWSLFALDALRTKTEQRLSIAVVLFYTRALAVVLDGGAPKDPWGRAVSVTCLLGVLWIVWSHVMSLWRLRREMRKVIGWTGDS